MLSSNGIEGGGERSQSCLASVCQHSEYVEIRIIYIFKIREEQTKIHKEEEKL